MRKRTKLVSLIVSIVLMASLFAGAALADGEKGSYVVKAGDNLTKIGKAYGFTWQELAKYNDIANPDLIYPGQVILIPETEAPTEPTKPTETAEPAKPSEPAEDSETPGGTDEADESTTITIFHSNDTHSRYAATDDSIGFAGISAIVKAEKAKNPNTLLLDAGDTLHGDTFATLKQGSSIVELLNAAGYDAMTTGNHDYNYGIDRLIELEGEMNFPLICANVLNQDGTPVFTPYIIKEVGGVKIAIFGLATPETMSKTHPDNVKGKIFTSPVSAAQKLVPELREKADVVIALTHIGWVADNERDSSQNLAKNVPGIDVIIDGHSHTKLENAFVNGVLIAQTGEYDNNLGKVSLTVEGGVVTDKSATLITRSQAKAYGEDEAVLAVVAKVEAEIETITEKVIATSPVDLDGERATNRTSETNLGNLLTQAMLEASGADVALSNGGGNRASIAKGPVTVGNVLQAFPFSNYGVVIEVTGADLLAAIEHGVRLLPEQNGGFPHIAGMKVVVNSNAPSGSRVESMTIGGEPVAANKTYTLVTNDFLAAGGDGYTMLADKPVRAQLGLNSEMFENYIAKKGFDAAVVDGRMTIK